MNMRAWMQVVLACVLVCGLSACGNKGKLKSPSQIAAAEAKKAKKENGDGDNAAPADAGTPEEGTTPQDVVPTDPNHPLSVPTPPTGTGKSESK